MADIMKWNPFEDMLRIRDDFNRFFGTISPWGEQGREGVSQAWGPSVDVHETADAVKVSVEIPGVNPGDLELTITDDSLTLRGEIKHQADTTEHGYRRIERRYGSFQRTIPFPVAVKHDQARADYQNGILQVTAPKAEPGKSKAIRLKINDNAGPKQLQ